MSRCIAQCQSGYAMSRCVAKVSNPGKLNFLQCCEICRSVAQCPGVLRNAKVGCAMSRCVAKVPNSAAISYCDADYSVRHLNENNENENNETKKLVHTLQRPPLREGPNFT